MNELEQEFRNEAESLGYVVYHRGWPDFLIVRNEIVQGVEVKGPNGYVTNFQSAMMNALANAGVDCWVYRGEWKQPDIVKEALQEESIITQIIRNYEWKLRKVRNELKQIKRDLLQALGNGKISSYQGGVLVDHIPQWFDSMIGITEEPPSKTSLRLIRKWERLVTKTEKGRFPRTLIMKEVEEFEEED